MIFAPTYESRFNLDITERGNPFRTMAQAPIGSLRHASLAAIVLRGGLLTIEGLAPFSFHVQPQLLTKPIRDGIAFLNGPVHEIGFHEPRLIKGGDRCQGARLGVQNQQDDRQRPNESPTSTWSSMETSVSGAF